MFLETAVCNCWNQPLCLEAAALGIMIACALLLMYGRFRGNYKHASFKFCNCSLKPDQCMCLISVYNNGFMPKD